ncbi:hypothetical protein SPFL3102_03582 [Sporomusaceae bacterium FL31]|nr:hypothetical protein SPFL3101_00423 [Sporomusaceae bacterium FL31]GCE35731.1 hypothetical protein SPFL3102_03582 [Sporomusaceae bacterium]
MIILEDLKVGQLLEFLKFVRPEDLKEVEAAAGRTLLGENIALLQNAQAIVQIEPGGADRLLGIGAVDIVEGYAVPWVLLTTYVYHHPIEFLRFSKRYLQALLQRYPLVGNAIHHSNILHLRWLEWLGCEWQDPIRDFRPFLFRRKEESSCVGE